MSGYIVKDPDSELELGIDWRNGYLAREETVRDDLGWMIRPVEDLEGELKVVFQECTATQTRASFAFGIPGRIYIVASRIETSADRVLERSILFRVAERNCG